MKFLAVLIILPALLVAEYTKLQWSDCGSREVTVNDVDIQPMPIVQPGKATLNFLGQFKRPLNGGLTTDLKIVRSVSGVSLPIRCYLAEGIYVGSCKYDDLCKIIQKILPSDFNPSVCPKELAQYGIDCTCPFKLKAGQIAIKNQVLDLPDAAKTVATFLATGDFDITLKTNDATGPFACVNIKFTVKKK